ncbi:MAG: Hsp70 family protein [Hyphomonadaceae bacterium]
MRSDVGSACVCLDLGTAMSKASVWLGAHDNDVAPLPIGLAAQAEHPLLSPSAMYVDDGRIFFGPAALKRAEAGVDERRNPIVSFKMILSAREIEPTLALKLSRSVDPTSTLCHRDGIVLYLAYLDQLIRAAVEAEPGMSASIADAPRRLTSPNWQSFDEAGRIIALLVDEAVALSRELGTTLRAPEGIALTRVRAALDAARAAPLRGAFGGVVFESASAASAYANFARASEPLVLVIDMGAGTTDIAAFERDTAIAPSKLAEITAANQCCSLAGDELDNILIDLFVRSGGKRGLAAEDRLWRAVKLSARSLKQDLFQRGESSFRDRSKKRIRITRAALEKDPSFRAFCKALTETVAVSLAPLHARAKELGAGTITVLLAGGGANLPFLSKVVRDAAARTKVKLKLKIERFGANWSLPHRRHPFDGVFPQLAIAMGGALAPVAHIAAREPAATNA